MTDPHDKTRNGHHAEPAGPDRMRVVLALVGMIGALAVFAMNMGE